MIIIIILTQYGQFPNPTPEQIDRAGHPATSPHPPYLRPYYGNGGTEVYPGTKVAIGPVTETGFFYDFDSPITFTRDNFPKIIKEMRRIIKANLPIVREVVSKAEIKAEIANLGEP